MGKAEDWVAGLHLIYNISEAYLEREPTLISVLSILFIASHRGVDVDVFVATFEFDY